VFLENGVVGVGVRPVVFTEHLARGQDSMFETVELPNGGRRLNPRLTNVKQDAFSARL
jgi:hypothetical protein